MRREQKERWGPCGYCFIIKIILIQIRGGEIFSLFPTRTSFSVFMFFAPQQHQNFKNSNFLFTWNFFYGSNQPFYFQQHLNDQFHIEQDPHVLRKSVDP